jgi:hypothetical protein
MGNILNPLKASPGDRPSFENRLTYADIPQAETTIPDTKKPETKSEDAKSRDTKKPETKSEDAKSRDTKKPETKSEDAKSRDTKKPETKSEDAKSRDTKKPDLQSDSNTKPGNAEHRNIKKQIAIQNILKTEGTKLSEPCTNQINSFKKLNSINKNPTWSNNGIFCYPQFIGSNSYKDLSVCLTQRPTCNGYNCPPIKDHSRPPTWDFSNCVVPLKKKTRKENYECSTTTFRYKKLSQTWEEQKKYEL